MIQGFIASPEFQSRYGANLSDKDFVRRMYANILRRYPDPGGWIHWTWGLTWGHSTRFQVAKIILESPESVNTNYWGVFVQSLYLRLLRRVGEESGFNFWVNGLRSGATGPLDVIAGFLEGYKLRFGCDPSEKI